MICTDTRITAGDYAHLRNREELCRFIEQHGEDRHCVNWVEYDVIDCPVLRFGVFLLDERGRKHLDPRDHDKIAMETHERALRGALPDWWQPAP